MKKTTRNPRLRKALLTLGAALLLVGVTLGVTVAYLTSQDEVVNTFTVGDVEIKLDEAEANEDGSLVPGADRVQANNYKLVPGRTCNKDPMVTVLQGSEPCYVRMTVTFSHASELDEIFEPGGADLINIFNGYDATNWIYQGNAKDAATNTRTYTFWYKAPVTAENDVALDALFDSITVPGAITNEQLATIEGMTITVNAYAIQAEGFENAADAWAAF
ncbi:MAG: SipW-dependent-type signal peptide-containing protein [Candidatus Excrementavichristensenella sp.]|jgi:predicted ribosomally synthesized peptide with SipW-like signal peptide